MRLIRKFTAMAGSLIVSACVVTGTDPRDPYEPINRKIHAFNLAFDATFLKPPAKFYVAVVPPFVRTGIENAYDNVYMLPTIVNDVLQAKGQYAIKDTWRFIINSTLGAAGLIDVATSVGIPAHKNDLGITFAVWGDKKSPYIVIPFLGPSTIRDGMSMLFDYTFFTPYPYISSPQLLYGIIGLRYVDLRSQFLESEHLMQEAVDSYSFLRDVYLQHRDMMITGEKAESSNTDDLYVEEGS